VFNEEGKDRSVPRRDWFRPRTADDLPRRFADFDTLGAALDYAAGGVPRA
jgi:hypothetical protein